LIYSHEYGVDPKKGRLNSIHVMSRHGASLLKDKIGVADKYCKYLLSSNKIFVADYWHRYHYQFVHIALDCFAQLEKQEVIYFQHYYDRKTENGIYKEGVRVQYGKPDLFFYADGILLLGNAQGKRTLYCIEYYEHELTGEMFGKIQLYLLALAKGYPAKQFEHNANARILIVFRKASSIRLLTQRLQVMDNFHAFRELFLFTSLEQILASPIEEVWVDYLGERINL